MIHLEITVKDWYAGVHMSRGTIRNTKRAQQINNFKGLRYGKITPTDLDGLIEYKDVAYVFIEVKFRDAPLPFGQRLALKRMVADLSKHKKAIAIVCEHDVADTNEQVDTAECKVREIMLSDEMVWRATKQEMKVKELIDSFLSFATKI